MDNGAHFHKADFQVHTPRDLNWVGHDAVSDEERRAYADELVLAVYGDTGGGKTMGTEGNLRLIKKIQPDVLIGMPTFLYHVLNEAVREGVQLPTLKKIVLGGEKAPTGMRRKLRALAAQLRGALPPRAVDVV